MDGDVDERVHWSQRIDWAGLSVFVLATAVGIAVVVVVTAEMTDPGRAQETGLAHALTVVLGAMVGAVSTYVGLYRRTPHARHRRDGDTDDQ